MSVYEHDNSKTIRATGMKFALIKQRTYQPRRQHRRESPHTSQRQETISRVCYKKSPSSAGKKEWDNGETGRSAHNVLPKVKTTPTPWQRPEIMFVTGHGPFPTYLKRFNIRSSDSCGCGHLGNPLHYATSCLFTTSYHLTKPSADLVPLWWKRVMNNNKSRAKIRKLIHFIAGNETHLFPKDGDNN
ncbi:hypothetical protein AVEN_255316-1 [Araneus ventricosus]|uniref:Uncharacterized protein n=1 Tax=Araneus ventricosus TaxID=182803 RepID=A0A4Y2NVH6_ARAVE|nr:hypothetical protein AVEN_255316-1 [Araneus ventricosus]